MGEFPWRRRRSRRLLAAACGVAAIATSAAACGSSGNSAAGAAPPTGGTAIAGGTATYALPPSTVPNYIFPFDSSTYFSVTNSEDFQYLLYRPLYWFGHGSSPALHTNPTPR